MRIIFLLITLCMAAPTLACTMTSISSPAAFARADFVVKGRWVEDKGEAAFFVEETWLGEELPSQKYEMLEEGLGADCSRPVSPFVPRDELKSGEWLLAVERVAFDQLKLKYLSISHMAQIEADGRVHLEYHGRVRLEYIDGGQFGNKDISSMIQSKTVTRDDFEAIEMLSAEERQALWGDGDS